MRLYVVAALALTAVVPARADMLTDCELSDDRVRAFEACTSVIESNESSNLELLRAYERRAKAQKLGPALEDIDRAISLGSRDDEIFLMRGNHHAVFQEYEQALEDYTQAIRLNPANREAHLARGTLYDIEGAHNYAIEDYSAAILLAPEEVATILRRAHAFANADQMDKAIADVDDAIRIQPDNSKHYALRAFFHSVNDDYERAVEDYSASIELNPNAVVAYNGRALAYQSLGNLDRAIQDYEEAIRLSDRMTAALFHGNRGMALMELRRHEEAIDDFNIAATGQIIPRRWQAEYRSLRAKAQVGLARDRYFEGRLDEGLELLQAALEVNWDDPFALALRGQILGDLGKTKEAAEAFQASTRTGGAELVERYQRALAEQGYDPGPLNGSYGEQTRAALEACLAAGCRLIEE